MGAAPQDPSVTLSRSSVAGQTVGMTGRIVRECQDSLEASTVWRYREHLAPWLCSDRIPQTVFTTGPT